MSQMPPQHYGLKLAAAAAIVLFAAVVLLRWRRRRRLARRNLTLTNAGLGITLLAAVLVAAEALFWQFYDQTDSFMVTNASNRWLERHARANGAGFRDAQEFLTQPAPGVYRITLFGDSYAFGYGIRDVRDRFGDRLSARMQQAAPGRVELYNLAQPGWDTKDHLLWLKYTMASGLRMHMLLLTYNPNDASPLLPETQQAYEQIGRRKPKCWLFRDTFLLNFLYYRVISLIEPRLNDYYSWVGRGFEEPVWSSHRAELEQIVGHCREHGIELRVVTFPLVAHVGPDYPLRGAHEKLGQFWREAGVPHLDLLGTFERHRAGELVVNRFDGHPNEFAHALAADAIYEWLVEDDALLQAVRRPPVAGRDDRAD